MTRTEERKAEMRELTLHTVRCDIWHIGMESDFNKKGIRSIIKSRHVDRDEYSITSAEFEETLDEQYAKVEAWRRKNWK